jgi:circadian clock protein KaiC
MAGKDSERVTTGIAGLDEMLSGGFLEGASVLLRGAPGTGKTTVGLQYLVHGARKGEPGLLISFEEFPQSLHRDAQALGWNLKELEDQELLHLHFTSPQVLLESLQSPDSSLSRLLLDGGIRRIVFDSVTHFTRVTNDPVELRKVYNTVINALKREQVTSLLLGEESGFENQRFEQGKLSYIVDAIVLLRFVEIDSTMQRAMVVIKMRGSHHAKDIRRFEINHKDGAVVTGVFEEREGILSGISHRIAAAGGR